jgi:transcriptional regulator with XRE-family HTH domain
MKTPGQRGAFGEWLTRARTRRFATQAEALREYERLAGLRITPSQYAQWESGSRVPRADNPKVARLFDFYGSQPEDEQQEAAQPVGDQAAIVAALDRQTTMLAAHNELLIRLIGALHPSPDLEAMLAERAEEVGAALGRRPGAPIRPPPGLPSAKEEP